MIERDSIGEIELPDDAYYGAYALRSSAINVTSLRATNIMPEYIKAIYLVKYCAAEANFNLGYLSKEYAEAIKQAATEGMAGKFDKDFIVDLYQGNGDVATIMNINEILSRRGNEILTGKIATSPLRPNDHSSCNQSTPDMLMTSARIATYSYICKLQDILAKAAKVFADLAEKHKKDVRMGRTELRDALPVTFGQNFQAFSDVLDRFVKQGEEVKDKMLQLPMGGTALGSGIGSVPAFGPEIVKLIAKKSELPFRHYANTFDATHNCDPMLDVAFYQEKVAATMSKIARDIRLLCSGPKSGFGELSYPPILPGSVTIPGKTNPTIEELVIRVNMRVIANSTMATQCIEHSELEYNYLETLMNLCVMESFKMMHNAYEIIIDYCFAKLIVHKEVGEKYAHQTGALAILLTPLFDYATATKVGIKCFRQNMNIADAVVEEGLMSREDANHYFHPLNFTDRELFYNNLEEAKKKYKK